MQWQHTGVIGVGHVTTSDGRWVQVVGIAVKLWRLLIRERQHLHAFEYRSIATVIRSCDRKGALQLVVALVVGIRIGIKRDGNIHVGVLYRNGSVAIVTVRPRGLAIGRNGQVTLGKWHIAVENVIRALDAQHRRLSILHLNGLRLQVNITGAVRSLPCAGQCIRIITRAVGANFLHESNCWTAVAVVRSFQRF